MELSTGTLKHGFLGVPKKEGQKVALRVTIRTFRDPILDTDFTWYPESQFLKNVNLHISR